MILDKVNLKLSKYSIFLIILSYRVILDLLYLFYLEPSYGSIGFDLSLNFFEYTYSLIALGLGFFTLKLEENKIEGVIWFFLYLSLFVPLTSFYGLSGNGFFWFSFITSMWFFINLFLNSNLLAVNFTIPIIPTSYYKWFTVIIGIIFSGIIMYNINVDFSLSLIDVYKVRAEKPTSFIPYSDYIINALGKVIIPLAILISLRKWGIENLITIVVGIFAIIVLYLSTGHKGIIFNLPFILVLYFMFKKFNRRYFIISLVFFLGILSLATIYWTSENNLMTSLIYRRTLMIPSLLGYYYHEFYMNNPIYLSNSIFSDLVHYRFELQPSYEISNYFFQKPEMAASNGILSDGFRHFGYFGVAIWMLVFAITLKIISGFRNKLTKPIILTMGILFAKTLIDGPLLTTLFTHGFILLFLIPIVLKPKT